MPLWAQLVAELRDRLRRGEFELSFPTDHDLVEAYGVSRHTAREAVRVLRDEGLIERYRGRGTFLRPTSFEHPVDATARLFHSVEAQGSALRDVIIRCEIEVESVAAGHLGLSAHTELIVVERVRWAGVEPLALERVWFPASLARPLLDFDLNAVSLRDAMSRWCKVELDRVDERIVPVVVSARDRKYLGVKPGATAFAVERLGHAGAALVEWGVTFLRGDRYAFTSRWSAHGAAEPLQLETEQPEPLP